jgi:hypothetical protein
MRWALIVLALGAATAGADAAWARPTLIVAIHARPADRPALEAALKTSQAARLQALKEQGALAGYRLLFSRYADAGVWDGLEVLSFSDEASLARWRQVEQDAPGALAPDVLRLTTAIESTPSDGVRTGGPHGAANPALLVIPYQALVPAGEYLSYLDDYTLPQFNGWIAQGVLDGFDVVTARYPADRAWSALIILRYRDDLALARRDEVTAKVRAQLAAQPKWKAISDNKKAIRTEKALAVADELASDGAAP